MANVLRPIYIFDENKKLIGERPTIEGFAKEMNTPVTHVLHSMDNKKKFQRKFYLSRTPEFTETKSRKNWIPERLPECEIRLNPNFNRDYPDKFIGNVF